MKKPKPLKKNSRIAIVSPSSGLAYEFPHVYNLGIKHLKDTLKFEIIEMPTTKMCSDKLYNNPKLRAKDINDAFRDPSIDGIIISIGGDDSIRILEHLDTKVILNNPKFIMGFSDSTTILAYLNTLGLTTFYGPSVMAGFAQLKYLPTAYKKHLKNFLFDFEYPFSYKPYEKYTHGYLDWSNSKYRGECSQFIDNKRGFRFLQGNSSCMGYLWGGCMEALEFMKGTKFWPSDRNFWNDKILLLETSEIKPTPKQIEYWLRNYGVQGIFNTARGIVFGRPKDYTMEEKVHLEETILRVVKEEFNSNIPILFDFDFGHTDPKLILPLGCKVSLNPYERTVILLEDPYYPF